MDILYLVDRLENLIANSRRMPLINHIVVKESDMLSILDQMRTAIPEEIKQARRILQERERILVQAQQDASDMLAHAREETEHVLSREGLLRKAEEHSQELVRRAEEHTEQLQADADAYVVETLRNLKAHLMSIEGELDHTLLSIEKGLESLEAQQCAQESLQDRADVDDEQDKSSSSSHALPRRASLATDTMGGPPTHQ
ncbi:MAG: hypothetical protein JO202_14095 [Ktedonobacteraceae bacterium]|nr:hypothetical protein [Ktedonobacteraceae bacterium]